MRDYECLCSLECGLVTLCVFVCFLLLLFEEFTSDALLGVLHLRDAPQFPSDFLLRQSVILSAGQLQAEQPPDLLQELSETTDVESATIDCWQQNSSAAVYHTLLNTIDPAHTRKRGTTAATVLWDDLCQRLDGRKQFVVVLDEADQLQDQQVLYQFYEHDSITPILIANRKHDFFVGLDDRVRSRVRGYSSVKFQNYTDDELVAILANRTRAALRPDAVSEMDLETIAANAHGDPRLAIAILRNAVRHADGADRLQDRHITAAVSDAQTELREDTLERLTEDQQVLFNILTAHGEQSLSELYERYCEIIL